MQRPNGEEDWAGKDLDLRPKRILHVRSRSFHRDGRVLPSSAVQSDASSDCPVAAWLVQAVPGGGDITNLSGTS